MSFHTAPEYVRDFYTQRKELIQQRLNEFRVVPPTEYFYELCYCICTPQSKAVNAWQVVDKLKEADFAATAFDPTPLLRNPAHYIRFHNNKATSLLQLQKNYAHIHTLLIADIPAEEKREWLVNNVRGIGRKEASHFLRNIGYRGIAIIDRHILKHLVRCGVIEDASFPSSKKKYQSIEQRWKQFAHDICIPLDELDLLFWSLETGEILK